MLNQVILVGRVKVIDKYTGIITVNIERKDEGVIDSIPIALSDELIKSTVEYISEGSTIGVKASINIDGNYLRIVGEKVTFINTKKGSLIGTFFCLD